MLLKFSLNIIIIINSRNKSNSISKLDGALKKQAKMTAKIEKNLCFTKYDQTKLKIIDIGANLSGNQLKNSHLFPNLN